MKYVKFVVVVFVLYFLGYVLGPTIAPMLVKEREKVSLTTLVEYKGIQYEIDLDDYPDDELPATVKITTPTRIPTKSGQGKVILGKGDTVKLLSRKDGELTVEKTESNGNGTITAADTDLFAQLAKRIYDEEAGESGAPVAAVTPVPAPTAAATPTPAPTPAPAPVAGGNPMPTPTPMPAPTPAAEPTPAATPTPAPAGGGKLNDEQIVALMKKSIADGAVKEFKAEQVKGWKVNGDETIDGTEYQTGLAAYEAATIFGVRPVQAKALIKDGKVERWVYAKSGMEIQ